MSTPLPLESVSNTQQQLSRAAVTPAGGWWREPLLHFLLLGGVLFVADHQFAARTDDPRVILVGADVDREAIQVFEAGRGRKPDAKELEALRRVWLDNELLYREGLALQVDKGDQAIRDRVIFKALSIIDASTKLPKYDDGTLRAWFEAHRDKFDEPARFDFEEAALTDNTTEEAVRAFTTELNGGAPGDAKAGLRVFKGRPRANLIQSYGEAFTVALEQAAVGEWRAVQTKDGWRAVRLVALAAPKPAEFDQVRNVVLQDWTDATLAEQRSTAVRALEGKYTVRYERATP